MKPKYPLFSEVVLLQDILPHNLKRGSVATVVEQYAATEPQQYGYSLEGFNVSSVTIEIDESQIISLDQ